MREQGFAIICAVYNLALAHKKQSIIANEQRKNITNNALPYRDNLHKLLSVPGRHVYIRLCLLLFENPKRHLIVPRATRLNIGVVCLTLVSGYPLKTPAKEISQSAHIEKWYTWPLQHYEICFEIKFDSSMVNIHGKSRGSTISYWKQFLVPLP